MKQEDPGPIKDKKVKEELKAKYGPVIDDGSGDLDKALEINPEYDDAMAYENLLIRERADLADTKDDYDEQIKIADEWVHKALDDQEAQGREEDQERRRRHRRRRDQK